MTRARSCVPRLARAASAAAQSLRRSVSTAPRQAATRGGGAGERPPETQARSLGAGHQLPRTWAAAACASRAGLAVVAAARDANATTSVPAGSFEDLLLECGRLTSLAHSLWARLVQTGDTVVDATVGNGQDTLILAQLALRTHGEGAAGRVVGFDIQAPALASTRERLQAALPPAEAQRVELHLASHAELAAHVPHGGVRLVAFNLGYLPGATSDKSVATTTGSTLAAVRAAAEVLAPGGLVSIMGYTGHAGGPEEVAAVLDFAQALDPREYTITHIKLVNRQQAPSLILLYRRDGRPRVGASAAAKPQDAE